MTSETASNGWSARGACRDFFAPAKDSISYRCRRCPAPPPRIISARWPFLRRRFLSRCTPYTTDTTPRTPRRPAARNVSRAPAFARAAVMIDSRVEPHDDEARAVGADEIGGLNEPQNETCELARCHGNNKGNRNSSGTQKSAGKISRPEAGAAHQQRENCHLHRLQRSVKNKYQTLTAYGKPPKTLIV